MKMFTPPFTVKRVADFISRFLITYKKGMEAMLEGYRDVTLNRSTFKFEDGTSPNERIKKFEDKLTSANFTGRIKDFYDQR